MTCSQCQGIESTFDEVSIRKELLFYAKDGLDDTTKWLVEAIKSQGIQDSTLLDIGGGIGGIQHELLNQGIERAVQVDGSSAYIEGAKRAAKERGLLDQIEWHHGDFVELADGLEKAHVVTLDRVICCFDDMNALVGKSVAKATRLYGLVYPRSLWYIRFGHWIINQVLKLRRNGFQIFIHPSEKVEKIIDQAGFRKVFHRETFLWQVALFAK